MQPELVVGEADLVEEHRFSAEMEEESGYFDGSARREDLRLPDPEKIAAAYLESDHAAEKAGLLVFAA